MRFPGQKDALRSAGWRLPRGGTGGACAPRASRAHRGRLSGRCTSSPPTVAEQWGACWGIPCTAKDGIRNNAPASSTVHWPQQVTAPPARWPASCSGFSTHGLSQRCTRKQDTSVLKGVIRFQRLKRTSAGGLWSPEVGLFWCEAVSLGFASLAEKVLGSCTAGASSWRMASGNGGTHLM